jgi:hypothetical protein
MFGAGLVKEWEFMPGPQEGTVLEPLDDPDFRLSGFCQARVDPRSRTVA